MAAPRRRPASARDASRSPAPETVEEGSRTRDKVEEPSEEPSEKSTRQPARVRQIHGGEVHWFNGGALARETR